MKKWTKEFHNYWKTNCEKNRFELNPDVNEAILVMLTQIEYLTNACLNASSSLVPVNIKMSESEIDKFNKKIKSLESKIVKINKRLIALEPPVSLESTGIFYSDGKPTKKKPK